MSGAHRSTLGAMGRVVGLLVGLYPAEFRRDYGPAIAQLVRDQRRDLGRTSRGRAAVFWVRVVLDLARTATVEHASLLRERAAAARGGALLIHLQLALGVVLLAASGGNVAFDLLSPKLRMGVGAAVLTAAAASSGTALITRARRARRAR